MAISLWCVLVAALLPVLTTGLAKVGAAYDNARPRESSANLPGRGLLSVTAWPGTRLIGLGLTHDFMAVQLDFSPDQARAIAAELLACADALNIAKPGGAA